MLWKCCTQFVSKSGKLSMATWLEKISFHSNPKEGQCQRMPKLLYSCAHFTCQQGNAQNHSSKTSAVHKPRSSRCTSWFRKGRKTRDQIVNICWITEEAREFQKNIYFCFIDYAKAFDSVNHNILRKILKQRGIPDHLTCLLRTCMQVKKQQLQPDMEQWTGSRLGKEYVKAVYCHPAYLTYMQSTSCEMLSWMKHKLESRLLEEISIIPDLQITHPYGRKWRRTKEPLDENEREE